MGDRYVYEMGGSYGVGGYLWGRGVFMGWVFLRV